MATLCRQCHIEVMIRRWICCSTMELMSTLKVEGMTTLYTQRHLEVMIKWCRCCWTKGLISTLRVLALEVYTAFKLIYCLKVCSLTRTNPGNQSVSLSQCQNQSVGMRPKLELCGVGWGVRVSAARYPRDRCQATQVSPREKLLITTRALWELMSFLSRQWVQLIPPAQTGWERLTR